MLTTVRLIAPLLVGGVAALVLAADAPTTEPSVSLGETKFHLIPPSANSWQPAKQPNPNVLAYITRKHDAIMTIVLMPSDVEMNPDLTEAILKNLRETQAKKKTKMIMDPTVESDDRFALKIHQKYESGTKTADRLDLYRTVGKRLVMVTVNTVADREEDVKAHQSAAEDVVLSASMGGGKNEKGAATRPVSGRPAKR